MLLPLGSFWCSPGSLTRTSYRGRGQIGANSCPMAASMMSALACLNSFDSSCDKLQPDLTKEKEK